MAARQRSLTNSHRSIGEELADWGKVALLETVGRSSGRPVSAAVGFVEGDQGELLVAAGSETADWARNLSATPICRATIGERVATYSATKLEDGPERDRALTELVLKYGTPAERLGRGPVFRLTLAEPRTDSDELDYKGLPDDEAQTGGTSSRGCGVIGCALIIAVLVALAAGVYFLGNALEPLADRYLWAPHDVVREYLAAYERDDTERARRFLCSDIRSGPLVDPAAPAGNPSAWTAGVEDTFPYPRPDGQVGIYYEVRSGLGERRAQALLEREDEGWRICAME